MGKIEMKRHCYAGITWYVKPQFIYLLSIYLFFFTYKVINLFNPLALFLLIDLYVEPAC